MNIIATTILSLPLLLPIFNKHSLTDNDIKEPIVYEFSQKDLEVQKEVFDSGNRHLILKTIQKISKSKSKNAADFLYNYALKSKDDVIIYDILKQLRFMPLDNINLSRLSRFFKHKNPDVLAQAVLLYSKNKRFNPRIIKNIIDVNTPPLIVNAVVSTLYEHLDKTSLPFWKDIINKRNQQAKKIAFKAIWQFTIDKPFSKTLLKLFKSSSADNLFLLMSLPEKSQIKKNKLLINQLVNLGLKSKSSSILSIAIEKLKYYPVDSAFKYFDAFYSSEDPEIRKDLASTLLAYPNKAALRLLLKLTNDNILDVRTQAIKTIIKIHPKYNVGKLTLKCVKSSLAKRRYAAYKIISELNLAEYKKSIISAINKEKSTIALSALIECIGDFKIKSLASKVANFANHKSKLIRINVALALAKLNDKTYFDTIKQLLKDSELDVQFAAINAIIELHDSYFLSSLVSFLNKTVSKNYNVRNRAAVFKAVSTFPTISKKMVYKVVTIVTRPVIPTMGGAQFDSETVRISALFALFHHVNKSKLAKKYIERITKQIIKAQELENGKLIVSASLISANNEVISKINNKPFVPLTINKSKITFPYSKIITK